MSDEIISATDGLDDAPLATVVVRRDAEIGVFACIPEEHADGLCACLEEDEIPFRPGDKRAARLGEPGCRTLLFPGLHPDFVQEELIFFGFDAQIDPAIVLAEHSYQPPLDKLLQLGNPNDMPGETDYAAHGITREHVPELIRMACDDELDTGREESPIAFGPVHAWWALGQLRAEEAVLPLLGLLWRIDEDDDAWVGEDVPQVLGRIGASAIVPAAEYFAETGHGLWARLAGMRVLRIIGTRHPELRDECVARLSEQLARFATETGELNGFAVSCLLDLHATEAAPLMAQAFAADRVEEGVCGDWEDAEIALGLKTEREKPRRPNKLTEMRGEFLASGLGGELFGLKDADDFRAPPGVPYVAPPKIGRNDLCPCGSNRKYKKCCERAGGSGALALEARTRFTQQ